MKHTIANWGRATTWMREGRDHGVEGLDGFCPLARLHSTRSGRRPERLFAAAWIERHQQRQRLDALNAFRDRLQQQSTGAGLVAICPRGTLDTVVEAPMLVCRGHCESKPVEKGGPRRWSNQLQAGTRKNSSPGYDPNSTCTTYRHQIQPTRLSCQPRVRVRARLQRASRAFWAAKLP